MPPTVYVETSVVSYLAARPTSDLVTEARQRLTRAWWATRRPAFALVIAPPVLTEAAGGDPAAAARRLGYLAGLPVLDVTDEAAALADALERLARLPPKAAVDALHIALAAAHGVEPADVEHAAHRQCRAAAGDRGRVPAVGVRAARDRHPRHADERVIS